jgi:phospholipid/cholesterol/gamma-HCH transport system permease protein
MHNKEPRLDRSTSDGAATLVLTGEWVAQHAKELERLASNAPQDLRPLTIDLSRIGRLDTFGAWSIETLCQSARAAGVNPRVTGIAQENAAILAQMRTMSRPAEVKERPGSTALTFLDSVGCSFFLAIEDISALLSLLGRLFFSFAFALRDLSTLKSKSVVHHIDQVGVRAVPIIGLMTLLIGAIIAQQGFFHFQKFGATDYVVDLVCVLVLREIGVLLVTIMVAGRSGSSYAAEIGSMKMREEIDALRTMGLDPIDVLILPRVLALVIALPMLTFVGMIAALYGAGIVAWVYGDISPASYLSQLREAVTYTDFEVGMIKAPVMALVIGTVASREGLRVEGSAAALGRRTTASVVKSIFLVIVLDGIFAILFSTLGM